MEPISVEFAGARVYEVPPNGQGIAALLALNILKELGVVEESQVKAGVGEKEGGGGGENASATTGASGGKKGEGEAAYLHRLIEVLRLAFADTRWYCADMDKAEVPVKELLGQPYAAERARLFDPARQASASVSPLVERGWFLQPVSDVEFEVLLAAALDITFVSRR